MVLETGIIAYLELVILPFNARYGSGTLKQQPKKVKERVLGAK